MKLKKLTNKKCISKKIFTKKNFIFLFKKNPIKISNFNFKYTYLCQHTYKLGKLNQIVRLINLKFFCFN